jgi:hypothetical protein
MPDVPKEATSALDVTPFRFDWSGMKTSGSIFGEMIPIAQFFLDSVEQSAGEELRRFDPRAACNVRAAVGLSGEFNVCGSSSSRRGGP